MHSATEFLNPRAKLVDEVADWLKDRARDDSFGGDVAACVRTRAIVVVDLTTKPSSEASPTA